MWSTSRGTPSCSSRPRSRAVAIVDCYMLAGAADFLLEIVMPDLAAHEHTYFSTRSHRRDPDRPRTTGRSPQTPMTPRARLTSTDSDDPIPTGM
jgi:hypothetical protein